MGRLREGAFLPLRSAEECALRLAEQASPLTGNDYGEGLRLIYIKNNKIEFKSKGVGESYIYRPTFYKFNDNSLLIACEIGFEYSTGIDVFELSDHKIAKLGYIDIAMDNDDAPISIVPKMSVERKSAGAYRFGFKGKVVINPGGKEERKIDGELITAVYLRGTGNISLMIRANR